MADKLTEDEKQEILGKEAVIKLHTVAQMMKIIDAACSRGAFRGEEMSFVGQLRDTLNTGLTKATDTFVEEKAEVEKKTKTVKMDSIMEEKAPQK